MNLNERRVRRYRRRLLHPRRPRFIKVYAAGALMGLPGPDAEAALMDGLGDPDPRVRMAVILSLDRRDPPVTVERIVRELRCKHGGSASGEYRPPTVTEIVDWEVYGWERLPLFDLAREGLAADDDETRRDAAFILAGLEDARARELLAELRQDDDPFIRDAVEHALDDSP